MLYLRNETGLGEMNKDITLRLGDLSEPVDTTIMCSCGLAIVHVTGPYWRKVDSGEVCVGGHWHTPANVSIGYTVKPLC